MDLARAVAGFLFLAVLMYPDAETPLSKQDEVEKKGAWIQSFNKGVPGRARMDLKLSARILQDS